MLPVQVHHRQVLTERASVQIPWTRGIVQLTHSIWSHQAEAVLVTGRNSTRGYRHTLYSLHVLQATTSQSTDCWFPLCHCEGPWAQSTGLCMLCDWWHWFILTRKYNKSMRSGMRTQHLKFALKKTLVVLLSSLIKKNKKLDSGKYSLYHLPLRYFTSILLCVTLTVINRFLKLLSRTTKLVEESLTVDLS